MSTYQPKTGRRCACRPGMQRDNCPACEGTGWQIDFAAIRARSCRVVTEDAVTVGTEAGAVFRQSRQLLAGHIINPPHP